MRNQRFEVQLLRFDCVDDSSVATMVNINVVALVIVIFGLFVFGTISILMAGLFCPPILFTNAGFVSFNLGEPACFHCYTGKAKIALVIGLIATMRNYKINTLPEATDQEPPL